MKNLHKKIRLLLSLTVVLFAFAIKTNAQPPLFEQWESNMITWGEHWGIYMQTYTPPNPAGMIESNNGIYYDAQRIQFQISDYTGQAEPWNTHAQEAERIYRIYLDNRFNYNETIPWFVQGWRRFSHGIKMDAERTADPTSVEGVLRMRDNGSFANVLTFNSTHLWYYERRSREIAYMISAHVNAEKFGLPRQEEALALYISMSMKHLDEWITETYADPVHRLSPFMVGLTSEALIEFYEWEIENNRDPSALFTHPSVLYNSTRTIPEALQQVAYHMRYTATVESGDNAGKLMWVEDMSGNSYATWGDEGGSGYSALRYESINNARPAPALNLLICPLYAWVFKQTGNLDYINIGDKLWEAGVATTNVGWNTKTYNQNYRWSFDYVKWRNEGMATLSINTENIDGINIYPNPVKDILTINSLDQSIKNYKIYNSIGQVVQINPLNEYQIDMSSLSNGVYFVKISSQSGKTITKKIIKN